jgi:hypothetical protein
MKAWKVWALLLFAALLPLRGVAAAALLCPAMAPTVPVHAAPEAHAHHHASSHDPAPEASDAAPADAAQACTLCCAVGSATPLLPPAPGLTGPVAISRLQYPPLDTPPPEFQSAGPERPPRHG